MEVHLKNRIKCKASELKFGEAFRTIELQQCHVVIDLSQTDMFESAVSLRSDVVYCVDLNTGVVGIIPKIVDVYKVNLRAEEL